MFFIVVNYLSRALRTQQFAFTGSKVTLVRLVVFDPFSIVVSVFQGLMVATIIIGLMAVKKYMYFVVTSDLSKGLKSAKSAKLIENFKVYVK